MKMSNGSWSVIQLVMLTPLTKRIKSMCIDGKESWMNPIKAYLKIKKKKAKKINK